MPKVRLLLSFLMIQAGSAHAQTDLVSNPATQKPLARLASHVRLGMGMSALSAPLAVPFHFEGALTFFGAHLEAGYRYRAWRWFDRNFSRYGANRHAVSENLGSPATAYADQARAGMGTLRYVATPERKRSLFAGASAGVGMLSPAVIGGDGLPHNLGFRSSLALEAEAGCRFKISKIASWDLLGFVHHQQKGFLAGVGATFTFTLAPMPGTTTEASSPSSPPGPASR